MSETLNVYYSETQNKQNPFYYQPQPFYPLMRSKLAPPPLVQTTNRQIPYIKPIPKADFPTRPERPKKKLLPSQQLKEVLPETKEMQTSGRTTPIHKLESATERKLRLALEKVENLECEVENLKSINKELDEKYKTLEKNKTPTVIKKEENSYYHEYWFMCRQFTELQQKFVTRAARMKEACCDASTQCDLIPTPELPKSNSISKLNISSKPITRLKSKSSLGSINSHMSVPNKIPPLVTTRKRNVLSLKSVRSFNNFPQTSNSEENMLSCKVTDMKSNRWLKEFLDLNKTLPYSLPPFYYSHGSPSSGALSPSTPSPFNEFFFPAE